MARHMHTASIDRVLITGGSGFIGSHLTEALLKHGCQVTIIDDLSTGRFENISHLVGHPRFRFVIDSIMNEGVMDRLARECQVIFHLAAMVGVELIVKNPLRVIETNILGTHEVLRLANRYHKKILIASTSEVYGKSTQIPFREDDDRVLGPTTKCRWSYATSKAVDEFLGLAYNRQLGLPVVIFRLFNTIGPRQSGQYGMVAPRFVQQALKGEPLTIYGDGQQSRCFCDVLDAVRALIGLMESPQAVGQVFNVGSTDEVTILELAQKVLTAVNRVNRVDSDAKSKLDDQSQIQSQIRFVPYEQAYEPGFEDMRRRVPDITKVKATIGWEPRITLEETIFRIIEGFSTKLAISF